MKAKAVEIMVAYDDGTVERWEGDKAHRVWSGCDWYWLDDAEKPTTTHPLRKVTKVRGWLRDEEPHDIVLDAPPGSSRRWMTIQHATPADAMTPGDEPPRMFDFVIDVTAVRVEEK